jgi:hypothetical protein
MFRAFTRNVSFDSIRAIVEPQLGCKAIDTTSAPIGYHR